MYKLKYFPKCILKMIYNSIVLPYLYYGIIIWGNASLNRINRVIKLQKRAIRIIYHAPYLAHTAPIFYSLKILSFTDMFLFQTCIFMYLCYNRQLPESLLKYFQLNRNIHSYGTRNASNFHLPKVRTQLYQKSLFYQGPIAWNSLPPTIQKSNSVNILKSSFRKYLLEKYL